MLGKLLKYEFQSMGRLLLFIYAGVIALAFVLGGLMAYNTGVDYSVLERSAGQKTLMAFLSIYVILLLALVLITMIMIILRFYRNLLGPEGYLMHTLPVPKWTLVMSKLITSLIWVVIGAAVSILSFAIILKVSGMWSGSYSREIFSLGLTPGQTAFEIILSVITVIAIILRFYFSMAVGNLANRHKFALAVIVFIGITIVISILQTTVVPLDMMDILFWSGLSGLLSQDSSRIPELVLQLILSAAFFTGTTWILQKHLNLA